MIRWLALALLLGCGGTSDGPKAAPTGFLALGDSYTIGESVRPAERWPVLLQARLAEAGLALDAPRIIARTGWSTPQLSAAITAAQPEGPFGLVTLLIGVNDQFRGGQPEPYRADFRAVLERAVALAGDACRVAVVSIPDYGHTPFGSRQRAEIGAAIDAFNAVNRAEAQARGVAWFEITDLSRRGLAEPALVAFDGLHPSGAQYARWAERIAPALMRHRKTCR